MASELYWGLQWVLAPATLGPVSSCGVIGSSSQLLRGGDFPFQVNIQPKHHYRLSSPRGLAVPSKGSCNVGSFPKKPFNLKTPGKKPQCSFWTKNLAALFIKI